VCTELLLQLINNILDTGKADIDRLEIIPKPTNLKELISKIWRITSHLINSKGLFGSIELGKDVPKTLNLDSTRMTQILLNLVSNSIKFTHRKYQNKN